MSSAKIGRILSKAEARGDLAKEYGFYFRPDLENVLSNELAESPSDNSVDYEFTNADYYEPEEEMPMDE